ncbi:cohesin domain-containing protein, partial [Anabaenopsis sp. FSS-46]|uniref:cohesin domain-containing protein n=1 Tax=Anabaenopsis sp. FSS-46 TaxID=2971766 RepID=UPI002474E3B6
MPNIFIPTDLTVKVGENIQVPVNIDDATGALAFNFTIIYDNNLVEFINVEKGNLTSNFLNFLSNPQNDRILVSIDQNEPLPSGSGSGSIAIFTFKVSEDALPGNTNFSVVNPVFNIQRLPNSTVPVTITSLFSIAIADNLTSNPGETITVPVTLNGATGVDSINFTINYNSAITLTGVNRGD